MEERNRSSCTDRPNRSRPDHRINGSVEDPPTIARLPGSDRARHAPRVTATALAISKKGKRTTGNNECEDDRQSHGTRHGWT